jgi:hypothetical protein
MASICPVLESSACKLPPAEPASSPTRIPADGVNHDPPSAPCELHPPLKCEYVPDAESELRGHSTEALGLIVGPLDEIESA